MNMGPIEKSFEYSNYLRVVSITNVKRITFAINSTVMLTVTQTE